MPFPTPGSRAGRNSDAADGSASAARPTSVPTRREFPRLPSGKPCPRGCHSHSPLFPSPSPPASVAGATGRLFVLARPAPAPSTTSALMPNERAEQDGLRAWEPHPRRPTRLRAAAPTDSCPRPNMVYFLRNRENHPHHSPHHVGSCLRPGICRPSPGASDAFRSVAGPRGGNGRRVLDGGFAAS